MREHIQQRLASGAKLSDIKADVMHTAIDTALIACYGNQTKASELLTMHRQVIRGWLNNETSGTYKRFEQVSLRVGTATIKELLTEAYREAVDIVMTETQNQTEAAKRLDCQRGTVRKYMK
jgi:DNA-binding protein Fis